jgi:Lhr-like helicase
MRIKIRRRFSLVSYRGYEVARQSVSTQDISQQIRKSQSRKPTHVVCHHPCSEEVVNSHGDEGQLPRKTNSNQ